MKKKDLIMAKYRVNDIINIVNSMTERERSRYNSLKSCRKDFEDSQNHLLHHRTSLSIKMNKSESKIISTMINNDITDFLNAIFIKTTNRGD